MFLSIFVCAEFGHSWHVSELKCAAYARV